VTTDHHSAAYYQDFSFEVGLRDWIVPNARHEQLKLLLADALDGSGPQRILDLGCGAGVMSAFLTSFGDVVAVDFSRPAVELGRAMAPEVDFRVGDAGTVPSGPFDVITLFDVLEHIPPGERPELLARLAAELAPGGRIVMSTPHPRYTRWLHEERAEALQVIDEPVDVPDLLEAAGGVGLELTRYETFDIDGSGPQYQLVVVAAALAPGGPASPRRALKTRMRLRCNPIARVLRRVVIAARLVRRGRPAAALWFVIGKGSPRRRLGRSAGGEGSGGA
jgi:SAM-dependent methyltransferase